MRKIIRDKKELEMIKELFSNIGEIFIYNKNYDFIYEDEVVDGQEYIIEIEL